MQVVVSYVQVVVSYAQVVVSYVQVVVSCMQVVVSYAQVVVSCVQVLNDAYVYICNSRYYVYTMVGVKYIIHLLEIYNFTN